MVTRRGSEVLRDRQQLAARVQEVAHGRLDLVALLAHTEDEVGLRHEPGRACRPQHVQRAFVPEAGPDPAEDPRDRLDVVRQHRRPRAEHLGKLVRLRVEVRDEQLHPAAGQQLMDLADRLGVQPRAAVREVVASDAGDRGVAQPHRLHRLGDPSGLVTVEVSGFAGVDLAEVATPRALVAADEERRLAVLPALIDVGAPGGLADGVQTLLADELFHRGELGAHPGPRLDPGRLALDRGLGVADLKPQQAAALGHDSGHVPRVSRRALSRPGR